MPGFHLDGTMCVPDNACTQICTPGQSECTGGEVKRCVPAGACWIWSATAPCGAGGCDGNDCKALAAGVTMEQWGSASDDILFGLASGAAGEVLAVGFACGILEAQTHVDACDMFVSSRNQNVAENWTRERGSKGFDAARSVARSTAGDVFVGGSARGSLATGEVQADDFVVTKWSADGVHAWDAEWGVDMRVEQGFALALSDDGSIFCTGVTEGNLEGANLGAGDATLTKLDSAGTVVWNRQWGTSGDDVATDVVFDGAGNVYIVGYAGGALPGQGSAGGLDAFLQKRSAADGAVLWTRQFGSTGDDEARGVAFGASGEVFVTGSAGGGLGRSGGGGAFLGKWQADGTELWIEQWGPSGTRPWAVELNAGGDVYVAGSAFADIDGATNAGLGDAFVSRWTQSGSTRARAWSRQFGTAKSEETYALTVHPDGAVYVGGSTFGTFPGFRSRGSSDLFLIRLSE